MEGRTNGLTEGQTDRWTGRQMDRQTEGQPEKIMPSATTVGRGIITQQQYNNSFCLSGYPWLHAVTRDFVIK